MEHPVRDFHDQLEYRNAKSPASPEAGLAIEGTSDDQPRVRERIMMLSKVYSAYSAVGDAAACWESANAAPVPMISG